jgi:hypothetical protein
VDAPEGIFQTETLPEIGHCLSLKFAGFSPIQRMSPAMAAGIETRLWEMKDLVEYIDSREPARKKRGPYKKKAA